MMPLPGPALPALGLMILGSLLIWRHWCQISKHSALLWGGWGAIALATPLWVMHAGPEFGVIYQLTTLSLCTWSLAMLGRQKLSAKVPQPRPPQPVGASKKRLAAASANAILLGAPAAALITLALCSLMPMDQVNRMVVASLLFPLLWAVVTVWVTMGDSHLKKSLSLGALALVSLGLYWGVM
ncbi:hypothetical protein F0521_11390 [Ferrimonas sp. YFM]|nr:hypothetical protein F0521_11390 [Ferrimonas sp. YFM]